MSCNGINIVCHTGAVGAWNKVRTQEDATFRGGCGAQCFQMFIGRGYHTDSGHYHRY